ncbi:hypothetical protein [Streptomyces sp. ML-6]|uniref:hypothetical protein n=1 Tax=Streptomyces sp. ML-6 TaxID=2982693 RepID=UPI0024C04154|nr:hypothetical protein [Streptomyces sp. ML-6]MDK0524578.1 hypothetical protein [Streptomyces sp. ML-6]
MDAPSEPSSRTSTESGTSMTTGGKVSSGARMPAITSESGPEEPDEPAEPAEETAAVVHAVGVSIGRNTSESEQQPDGDDATAAVAAAAAAAQEEAPKPRKAAPRPSTASVAVGAPTTSSDTAEAESGPEAKAATPSASAPASASASASASAESATASASATTEQTATATSTASSTATATASATASSVPPAEGSAGPDDAPERPGRVSRPMVVAAAFAGALLLATPFIVAGAQQDEPDRKTKETAAAWKDNGEGGGYVPGTDPDRAQGKGPAGSKDRKDTAARHGKGPAGDLRADTGAGGKPVNNTTDTKTGDTKDTKSSESSKSTGGGTERPSNSGTGGSSSGEKDPGTPAKAPSTGTAPKSTTSVVYSGVSGPECDTQRFQQDGYYTDGKEGWATHSGGYGGSGCDGKYLSMPMSGSASKDSGGSATWLFDLPSTAKKCSVSVHVPGSSNVVQVGGNPSYYTVYDRFLPRTNNLVGSFTIRQTDRRGTWYNVPGTFPVDAMKLSVRLHDRGEDDHYEHHAISAVKVTCTG